MPYSKHTMPPARRLVRNKDLTQNALKRVETEAKKRVSAKEKALKDLVDAARERTEDNRPLVRAGQSSMRAGDQSALRALVRKQTKKGDATPKTKRTANSWVQALKMWNEAQGPNGMWCIPKKGTAAFAEVKALQK